MEDGMNGDNGNNSNNSNNIEARVPNASHRLRDEKRRLNWLTNQVEFG